MSDANRSWPRAWHADASLPVSRYMQRGMRYVALGMRADKIVQFMWDAGLTDEPGDTVGNDAGLPGSGPGENEQRPARMRRHLDQRRASAMRVADRIRGLGRR